LLILARNECVASPYPTYAIARPSVVCLSFVGNAFGTLAIRWHPGNILRRSSQGNPFVGGVKHNRGSQI